jgi:hypothetical protein
MICIYGARLQTLVNDIVGNDTPTKKPKTTPTMGDVNLTQSIHTKCMPTQSGDTKKEKQHV